MLDAYQIHRATMEVLGYQEMKFGFADEYDRVFLQLFSLSSKKNISSRVELVELFTEGM